MTESADRFERQTRSRQRLTDLLDRLAQEGLSQQQVASRANLPPQYLSDIKCGRRPITELVARRLGDEFDVNYAWLLGTSNNPELPGSESGHSAASPAGNWLPLVRYPIEGEPRTHPVWDGTLVEISGIAAAKLVSAKLPYVLCFGKKDVRGRLQKNDLVLISQSLLPEAEISVVRFKNKLFLARQSGESWERVANGQRLPLDCPAVGHCVGLLWRSLYAAQEPWS